MLSNLQKQKPKVGKGDERILIYVDFQSVLFLQQDLIDFCNKNTIQYEAWSPMMQGKIFELDEFQALAEKYGRTVAQIVLRWDVQKGVVTIPKSTKKERIIANADIFDFELKEEDMALLDGLHRGQRFGPDPDNFDF